jgi:UDP-glucose 4-epimerase
MKILLTGGAGYIGSCVANYLLDHGNEVIILDNLSTGSKKLIPKESKFIKADISDFKIVNNILATNKFDILMHFAAFIRVEESVKNKKKYYLNNYKKSKFFLNLCLKNNLKKIIFSSTAAVYGNNKNYVSETTKTNPLNPYASYKLKLENFIKKKFEFIILRYFNVAGADSKLRSGQMSKFKSTHLIKKLCESAANSSKFYVYGNDYKTSDKTAVRDYMHVSDLANIHLLASRYLLVKQKSNIFNCGYGYGYSVLHIIKCFEKILKIKIPYSFKKRRPGDVGHLVSKNKKIKLLLKWKPKYNDIKKIIKSSYDWESKAKN